MIPGGSAGSNQVGANETCTPQVSCPFGSAAAAPGTTSNAARASSAATLRRVVSSMLRPPLRSVAGERHVLVGRRVGVTRDQAEPRFLHAGTGAVEEGLLPEMPVDRPLIPDLLDLFQRPFAPLTLDSAP